MNENLGLLLEKELLNEITALKADRDLWKDRAVVVAAHLDYEVLCGDIQQWVKQFRADNQRQAEKIAALKADFTQAEESRKTNVLMYERALLDCQRQAEEIAAKCEYINILQRLIKNHAQKCRGWFGIGQDDAWEVMVKALKQEEVFDFNTELEKAFPDSGEEPRTIDGHVVWVKKKQEEVKG